MAVLWTGLIVFLAIWTERRESRNVRELIANEARVHFDKDQAFRLWASKHGGVYVPPTGQTPPNSYLSHIPERDIVTASGKKLTLMNPAYVVRQLMEDYEEMYGIKGHITSLKPLRPENAPDWWEKEALESFEHGETEAREFTEIDGKPFLRLMRPMNVKPSCLKCHAHQGYKVGDVRGGVSVSVPARPFFREANKELAVHLLSLALLWLTGLAGIAMGAGLLQRRIRERERMAGEVHRLRNYLSNIINSMPSLLVGVDNDGKVTQWNAATEQTTGISAAAAQGKNLSDVFPRMASEMEKITESIRSRQAVHERKKNRPSKDGTGFEDVTIYPLIANGVEGAVIRIDDVTDKVRMEEMMIQSEKMLSVGGLAAGMAHEINNPLAGMLQTARVMAGRLGTENTNLQANIKAAEAAGTDMETIRNFMEARGIPDMIETINQSGLRVAEIVHNMLSFARKSDDRTSSYVLTELLDKTLELAATDYDLKKHFDFKKIEIKKEYEEDLPPVPCESGKIQQVVLNILRNGSQAMQEAATINPRFTLRVYSDKERQMVCMEIEDNGPGMDETTRKRVFEPFFTTKPVGDGTGLGLSVSYFIITENHNGEMTVHSNPGAGSTFIIRLPGGSS
jgi:PAS domain S-box-containing protein